MKIKDSLKLRRSKRVRGGIHGTAEIPRMRVKRSLKHIYVQIINDDAGATLAAASDKDVAKKGKPAEVAKEVGKVAAKRAMEKGISRVVFDRGSHRYHGRVAALADGAREAGLKF